jgi:hypothetical protein
MLTLAPETWIFLVLSNVCAFPAWFFIRRWLALVRACRKEISQGHPARALVGTLSDRFFLFFLIPGLAALYLTPLAISGMPEVFPASVLGALSIVSTLFLFLWLFYAAGVIMWLSYRIRKEPRYLYTLPVDSRQVLVSACKRGIMDAAYAFPYQIFEDDEALEGFVRAYTVLGRMKIFVPGRRLHLLPNQTNDFALYCELTIRGYRLGYRRFFQECLESPDHQENLCKKLRHFSIIAWFASSPLRERVRAYLAGEEELEQEQE